jgi:hypothetical protein
MLDVGRIFVFGHCSLLASAAVTINLLSRMEH